MIFDAKAITQIVIIILIRTILFEETPILEDQITNTPKFEWQIVIGLLQKEQMEGLQ